MKPTKKKLKKTECSEQELQDAVDRGHFAQVLDCLQTNVFNVDLLGNLVIRAARKKHYAIVSLLLDNEANVNTQSQDFQMTALHEAVLNNNFDIAKLLLDRGANVDAVNIYKETPLMFARNYDIAQLLLKHGANPNAMDRYNMTPLMFVIGSNEGAFSIVKLLVNHGANVNASDSFEGITPLTLATYHDLKTVIFLVHHGAVVNASDKSGYTVLMRALHGNIDILRFLLQHGANINATTESGNTALMVAASIGSLEKVVFLIEHGADVSASDQYGQTALTAASKSNSLQVTDEEKENRRQIMTFLIKLKLNNNIPFTEEEMNNEIIQNTIDTVRKAIRKQRAKRTAIALWHANRKITNPIHRDVMRDIIMKYIAELQTHEDWDEAHEDEDEDSSDESDIFNNNNNLKGGNMKGRRNQRKKKPRKKKGLQ